MIGKCQFMKHFLLDCHIYMIFYFSLPLLFYFTFPLFIISLIQPRYILEIFSDVFSGKNVTIHTIELFTYCGYFRNLVYLIVTKNWIFVLTCVSVLVILWMKWLPSTLHFLVIALLIYQLATGVGYFIFEVWKQLTIVYCLAVVDF